MLENEFIKYEEALALKELGFDEPCFIYWVHDGVEITFSTSHNKSGWSMIGFKNSQMIKKAGLCSAPTFSQCFRWFREKYGLCSWITMELGNKSTFCWVLSGEHTSTQYAAYFHTYEEAELACIIKLIEIVKNKSNENKQEK
jgi:hypothetical protein